MAKTKGRGLVFGLMVDDAARQILNRVQQRVGFGSPMLADAKAVIIDMIICDDPNFKEQGTVTLSNKSWEVLTGYIGLNYKNMSDDAGAAIMILRHLVVALRARDMMEG